MLSIMFLWTMLRLTAVDDDVVADDAVNGVSVDDVGWRRG